MLCFDHELEVTGLTQKNPLAAKQGDCPDGKLAKQKARSAYVTNSPVLHLLSRGLRSMEAGYGVECPSKNTVLPNFKTVKDEISAIVPMTAIGQIHGCFLFMGAFVAGGRGVRELGRGTRG